VLGLFLASPSLAEDAPLRVAVDDQTYLVSGGAVLNDDKTELTDPATLRKAQFAGRVLRELADSEFNKALFGATTRAEIFHDEVSRRLMVPWQKELRLERVDNEAALATAKAMFKAWATQLAGDRSKLALAIARADYLAGFTAYRENAAIYRSVIARGEPLTYDDALSYVRNEWLVGRLVAARDLEKQLTSGAAPSSALPGLNADDTIRQKIQTDVIDGLDAEVKTADQLVASDARIRDIVISDSSTRHDKMLGGYMSQLAALAVQLEVWAAAFGPEGSAPPP
jgi:hypothetical protein